MRALQRLIQVFYDTLDGVHFCFQFARHVGAVFHVLGDVERVHERQTGQTGAHVTLDHQECGTRDDNAADETQSNREPESDEALRDVGVSVLFHQAVRHHGEVPADAERSNSLDAAHGFAQSAVNR